MRPEWGGAGLVFLQVPCSILSLSLALALSPAPAYDADFVLVGPRRGHRLSRTALSEHSSQRSDMSAVSGTTVRHSTLHNSIHDLVIEPIRILLVWSGGTAPYYVDILPGGQELATPLQTVATAVAGKSYVH